MREMFLRVFLLILLAVGSAACESSDTTASEAVHQEWEQVSRDYRVSGEVVQVMAENDQIIGFSIKVDQNLKTENNPADFDFVGQTLDVRLVSALTHTDSLKENVKMITTIAQFADENGKVFYAAQPERTFLQEGGAYVDLLGSKASDEAVSP
ncbi:MAG: hypothetical protein H0Z34_06935 [Brevibacillus sp.]|nr:hypothetical protein [Brevibacillus sp.]